MQDTIDPRAQFSREPLNQHESVRVAISHLPKFYRQGSPELSNAQRGVIVLQNQPLQPLAQQEHITLYQDRESKLIVSLALQANIEMEQEI